MNCSLFYDIKYKIFCNSLYDSFQQLNLILLHTDRRIHLKNCMELTTIPFHTIFIQSHVKPPPVLLNSNIILIIKHILVIINTLP